MYGVWTGTYGGNSELIAVVGVHLHSVITVAAFFSFYDFHGQGKT
jgi:hypothetical protein